MRRFTYFEDCTQNGCRFAAGGVVDRSTKGWFIPVTLVDNPPESSRIVSEEPFGPILPVLKWKDEADVIALSCDAGIRYGEHHPRRLCACSDSPRNLPAQVIQILKAGFPGLRVYRIREVRYALLDAQTRLGAAHIRPHPAWRHE